MFHSVLLKRRIDRNHNIFPINIKCCLFCSNQYAICTNEGLMCWSWTCQVYSRVRHFARADPVHQDAPRPTTLPRSCTRYCVQQLHLTSVWYGQVSCLETLGVLYRLRLNDGLFPSCASGRDEESFVNQQPHSHKETLVLHSKIKRYFYKFQEGLHSFSVRSSTAALLQRHQLQPR